MDIFQKIAKEQPMDFRVFQNKKPHINPDNHKTDRTETTCNKKESEPDMKKASIKKEPKGFPKTDMQQEKSSDMDKVEQECKNTIPKEPQQEEKQSVAHSEKQPEVQKEPSSEKQSEAVVISFPTPKNLNEEAVLKLEVQLETQKSHMLPVFPIVRYLRNKCLEDTDFASNVNDEKKTLEKCFQFVMSEVQKAFGGSNGWLDDNEVYALAEIYFLTDEAVFEKMEQEKKEAEKRRQEEVAKKRKEQEEKRKAAAKKSKNKTTEKKKTDAAPLEITQTDEALKPMQAQLSLV